jgi:excisionase family DNA binding protein
MHTSNPKRALTIEEFAERWSIGRNSVYNAIARGELGSVKIGKRRVITLEQEEAFRKLMEKKSA